MKLFNHKTGTYIQVDKTDLYVEDVGTHNGFPLIFLHGGLGTIEDFSLVMQNIRGNFRCIGIDSRGHGKSKLGTRPFNYELFENDVQKILETLGILKCFIIGFSDGGILAYRLAMNHPSMISKIVTIGADWNPPDEKLKTIFSSLTAESWKKKFPESVDLYEQLNPEPNFNHLIKNIIPMWQDLSASGYPGANIHKIKADTLIIRGDNDHLMPAQSIEKLKQHLPESKFLNVPFAGHAAHIEQPEIVGTIINQFFNDNKK